jgi:two-component system, OmpR family, response regulator VicR
VRRRVVVVNDDPAILDLYRDVLHELDYEPVALATKGIESDQIRAHDPDAVILDLQVGEEGEYGIAMAIQLRSDARLANIPILVCTADRVALDGARRRLKDIGVPALLKPVSIEAIDEVLSTPVGRGSGTVGGQ